MVQITAGRLQNGGTFEVKLTEMHPILRAEFVDAIRSDDPAVTPTEDELPDDEVATSEDT